MLKVQEIVERIAERDIPVLLTGESGTGKEVVADLVHRKSKCAAGPCVKINCAALPRELIESELFGHIKGSFSGAAANKDGLFRKAENGSIFLDEIGDMPFETQSKLLRVLQEKQARPVGATADYPTNCRVIAATNRDPQKAIVAQKLREDLYYRLSAIELYLPPLRERREEIIPLARRFLAGYTLQHQLAVLGFSGAVEESLVSHPWPGNVRQLVNVVHRAALLCCGPTIELPDIDFLTLTSLMTAEAEEERDALLRALEKAGGNKTKAARILGVHRDTVYSRLRAYKLEEKYAE